MEKTVGYFAVIPANVRYDNGLCPNAKLLYGEITALSNQEGYCWAQTKYFADLYGVSKQTVHNWINKLIKCGYVAKKVIYAEDGKTILQRVLSIVNDTDSQKNFTTLVKKSLLPSQKNLTTPSQKNLTNNNININNKYNKSSSDVKSERDEDENTDFARFVDWVKSRSHHRINNATMSTQAVLCVLEHLTPATFAEEQQKVTHSNAVQKEAYLLACIFNRLKSVDKHYKNLDASLTSNVTTKSAEELNALFITTNPEDI